MQEMHEKWVQPRVRKIPWRRKGQFAPVFLPGKFHRQRNLVGYNQWSCKRLDTTEQLSTHMDGKMGRSARNVHRYQFSSVQFSCSVCDPMNCSTTGLPVHHQLPEFTQTHIHRVGDAILPSHSLSSPSPPALNPSQHQGLFQ